MAVLAQDRDATDEVYVEFEEAQRSIVNGSEIILLLNVTLRQGETFLRANRMRDEGDNVRMFTGDVQIVERGDTVYADVVRFDSNTKIGEATGNVQMTDGAVTLTANSAVYRSNEKRTRFESGVQYADSLTLLSAQNGTYWSDDAQASFRNDVRLRQYDLYVEADSVTYLRDEETFSAGGHVRIERMEEEGDAGEWTPSTGGIQGFSETVARTLLYGAHVLHEGKADSSLVTGDVLLLRTSNSSSGLDSLMMRSEYMYLNRDETGDHVIAVDSVVIVEEQFSVVGDSLVYDRQLVDELERFYTSMFGAPLAWINESQISSDSLMVWGSGGETDSLRATGGIFVASRDSTIDRIQQLKGRTLVASFQQDSLESMIVSPNAEALYYIEPDPGEPVVAILSSADRIEFRFENGSIMDVHAIDGVEGTFYPDNLVDQAQDLPGFSWNPEKQPNRMALMNELVQRHRLRMFRGSESSTLLKGKTGEDEQNANR